MHLWHESSSGSHICLPANLETFLPLSSPMFLLVDVLFSVWSEVLHEAATGSLKSQTLICAFLVSLCHLQERGSCHHSQKKTPTGGMQTWCKEGRRGKGVHTQPAPPAFSLARVMQGRGSSSGGVGGDLQKKTGDSLESLPQELEWPVLL